MTTRIHTVTKYLEDRGFKVSAGIIKQNKKMVPVMEVNLEGYEEYSCISPFIHNIEKSIVHALVAAAKYCLRDFVTNEKGDKRSKLEFVPNNRS